MCVSNVSVLSRVVPRPKELIEEQIPPPPPQLDAGNKCDRFGSVSGVKFDSIAFIGI